MLGRRSNNDLAMNVKRKIHGKPFRLSRIRHDPSLLWILLVFFTIQFCFFSSTGPNLLKKGEPRYLSDKNNTPLIFNTTRYNWIGRRLNSASALDYSDYPDAPKLVITTVVSNHQVDIDKLCRAFKSLTHLGGDVKGYPTPILVFNDGTLSNFQLEKIVQSTERPIAFPLENDLDSFPEGFVVKQSNDTNNNFDSNSQWFYSKVATFWVYTIWKSPALAPFDFIMRMDFDTCFHEDNAHLPDFAKFHKAYHSQYVGTEPNLDKVEGLFNFATNYMATKNILPTNPLLWQLLTNTWVVQKTLPLYQVSLEVIRKSFMQHPDVMKFHEAVAMKEPYGIFKYGWSDHVLRFIDTAMFVSNENFMTTEFKGFSNRERCSALSSSIAEKAQINKDESKEEKKLEEITIGEGTKIENQSEENNGNKEISKENQQNIEKVNVTPKDDKEVRKENQENKEKVNASPNGDKSLRVNEENEVLKRQERQL